jgi:hypothetical protein
MSSLRSGASTNRRRASSRWCATICCAIVRQETIIPAPTNMSQNIQATFLTGRCTRTAAPRLTGNSSLRLNEKLLTATAKKSALQERKRLKCAAEGRVTWEPEPLIEDRRVDPAEESTLVVSLFNLTDCPMKSADLVLGRGE